MEAWAALERLGGVATTGDLLVHTSRRRLRTALARGEVVRATRGRLVLPAAGRATAAAARLGGTVSHVDAALCHGWEVRTVPRRPHVTVDPRRRITPARAEGVALHWKALSPADASGGVTVPLRTVLDCARDLPFDEALTVADSALRHRAVPAEALREAAAALRGPGSARARSVAALADARAANPFESVLRALALEEGLDVVPQLPIDVGGMTWHPDLADVRRRLLLEADSWSHHAGHFEHDNDCVRYNVFVTLGWRVLRFTWPQVMHDPDYVRRILRRARGPLRQEQRSPARRGAAGTPR